MATKNLERVLARFTLFQELDFETRQQIADHMRSETYRAKQVIALAGEPCRAIYLIVRGEVRMQRSSPEGREYVLDTLGPGQYFDLSSALDGAYNVATALTLSDTRVYALSIEVFRQVVREHPELALAVVGHLAGRVHRLCDAVEDLALYDVRTRLARRLLSAAGDSVPKTQYWTQDEIARHIGSVRDVVGRALRAFAHEGLIERDRGRLIVTDTIGLSREAMVGQSHN